MIKKFEFFVAQRYLKAKRKGLFTLITTLIAIAAIAVGVATLITTLSVMNGFQKDIQDKIIGAQAHVIIYGDMSLEKYEKLEKKLLQNPHIQATAPAIYGQAILSYNKNSTGIILRGLDPEKEKKVSDLDRFLTQGNWHLPETDKSHLSPIVLGRELAYNIGITQNDEIILISPQTAVTAIGIVPRMKKFKVSGLLKTGYYEFDNTMAYTTLKAGADFLNLKGNITGASIKLFDIHTSAKVAKEISTNKPDPLCRTQTRKIYDVSDTYTDSFRSGIKHRIEFNTFEHRKNPRYRDFEIDRSDTKKNKTNILVGRADDGYDGNFLRNNAWTYFMLVYSLS
jgi:lipoprotein-releasing system permease protein